MAKTADSYEYEDGSGGVVERRDGRNVVTTHFVPNEPRKQVRPRASSQGIRISDVGKARKQETETEE